MRDVVSPTALGHEAGTAPMPTNEPPEVSAAAQALERGDQVQPEQAVNRSPSDLISPPLPSFDGLMGEATAVWRELMAIVRGIPGMLTGLALLVLVWTRVLALEQGMWGDELFSAIAYIRRGPSAIFSEYVPNDHMLFELLTWASIGGSGHHSDAAYRFWSVAPAIAAVVLMTWWLWRRLDRWVAAIFAVLATASPMALDLGTEARGYGLGFLSGVVMVIGADRFAHTRSRRALALLAAGGLIGIWTLPVMVLAFVGVAGVLLVHRMLRRRVLIMVGLVGAASLLFYAPVLSELLTTNLERPGGPQPPWDAAITGPLRSLLAPSVSLMLPHVAVGVGELLAGLVLLVGIKELWSRPERLLAMLLVVPASFTYLCLAISRLHVIDAYARASQLPLLDVRDRYTSYLLLPLLAAAAAGLVAIGRWMTRVRVSHGLRARLAGLGLVTASPDARPLAVPVAVGAVVLSLLALGKIDDFAHQTAEVPVQSFKEVGAIVRGSQIDRIMTNSTSLADVDFYIKAKGKRQGIQALKPAALEAMFCRLDTGFIYIEEGTSSPRPNTTCLRRRGAVAIRAPERRGPPMLVYILRGAVLKATERPSVALVASAVKGRKR
jgi:hypothetical protein